MSVKVHEAFSIDSFQDRLLWYDDFLGDQIQDEWGTSIVAGATVIVVDQQTGGICRILCPNGGDSAFIYWSDIRSLLVSKKVTMETRLKISSATNIFADIALWNTSQNRIQFLIDGATWDLRCEDNNIETVVDSGVTIDTNYHIFRIECFPTGQVHFYIDGVETANSPITTNIPPDQLQPLISFLNSSAGSENMDIDYVVVRQEI